MSRQSSSGLMVTVVSIVGGVYLAVLVCGFLVNYSTAHPQLQFDDQTKASGNELLSRLRRKYEVHSLHQKIKQQLQGKAHHPPPRPQGHAHAHHTQQPQPVGSFGHHSHNYVQPISSSSGYGGSGSYGEGIGSSNTLGSYGHSTGGGLTGAASGYGGSGGGGGGGYGYQPVGPVFTFVRTDHHGNFQWGVRHKVAGGWGR